MEWFFFIYSFVWPIYFYSKRSNLLIALWLIIGIHQLIAIINAYFTRVLGAEQDAMGFYHSASALAKKAYWHYHPAVDAQFYTQWLATIYHWFQPSLFLGEQISILAFIASCGMLMKLVTLLKLENYRLSVLLLYGLYPPVVFFTSVTLREPYIVLFSMLMVYYGLCFLQTNQLRYLFMTILFGLIFAMWHTALIVLMAAFMLLLVIIQISRKQSWTRKKILMTLSIVLATSCGLWYLLHIPMFYKASLFNSQILEKMYHYRHNVAIGRTHYGGELNPHSIIGFIVSSIPVYINYLFAPFPWQVSSVIDIPAMFCGWFKLLLFIAMVWTLFQKEAYSTEQYLFRWVLFLAYFMISYAYSLGTVNFGTALRHGLLHYWILLLLGWPTLQPVLNKLLSPLLWQLQIKYFKRMNSLS